MVFSGGSNRVAGSQIDGGRTVRSSMNSSTPSSRSCRVVALYATSQNTYREKQECVQVGCVPTAAVAISGRGEGVNAQLVPECLSRKRS